MINKRFAFVLLVVLCTLLSCKRKQQNNASSPAPVEILVQADTIQRTSITFILGKDDEYGDNPYYTLANHYYRIHPLEKTEMVVDSLSSLSEVMNYLETHRPENGLPWGLINLVSHGNEFVDLSMRVIPQGHRTSAQSLKDAVKENLLQPLDTTLIDSATTIYLHGCAVGNNQGLLDALIGAIGGKFCKATLKASKLFEYYAYTSNGRNPQSIKHYFAKVWYAFYNPDTILNENKIIGQLKKRYPTESVNWSEAIRRDYQTNPSQCYHITFIVPVVWDDIYKTPDERPIFFSQEEREQWLKNQKGLHRLIRQTKVPASYFDMKYNHVSLKMTSGDVYYSMRVKARAGVMCLIQPLINQEQDEYRYEPFKPETNDTCFFGFGKIKP